MVEVKLKDFSYVLLSALLVVVALIIPKSIVALAVGIIIGILAFLQPKQGIMTLLVYYPLRAFLIEISPSLKILGDMITFFLLLKVIWFSRRNIKSLFQFQNFEWFFLAFLVVGSVSAFITGVSISSIILQLRAFIITFLLLYIGKRLDFTKEDLIKAMWALIALAILLCVHGLIEKLSLRNWLMPEKWRMMDLSPTNRIRIYGLIGNPNVLAYFLGIVVMITLYMRTLYQTKGMRIFFNVCLVLFSGIFILTYSRGSIISFSITAVVYFLFSRNWAVLKTLLLGLIASVLLVYFPVSTAATAIEKSGVFKEELSKVVNYNKYKGKKANFKSRMNETFNEEGLEKSSSDGRIFLVKKGFEIYKDHPVMGTGFGTFGDSAAVANSSPIYKQYKIGFDIYSDNQYIQIIAQTGTLGVLLFAGFLLSMLAFLWKKRADSPAALVLMALLLGAYASGAYYNIWEDKTFTSIYFLSLAILVNYRETKGRIKV